MKATLIGAGMFMLNAVVATVIGHFVGVDPTRVLLGFIVIEFYRDKAEREGK